MNDVEPVNDPGDPRAQRIADLAKPGHANTKVALVEDAEPLTNALRAKVRVAEVYYDQSYGLDPVVAEAAGAAGVPVIGIDPAVATRLFRADKRPKVFGIAKIPRPATLDALNERPGDIVVLDGVRIVGNIGAIIRTATGLGAAGVVLLDSGLTAIADRRLLRASRGYVFSLPVIVATASSLERFLVDRGIATVVLEAAGPVSLAQAASAQERLALVFGAERDGPSAVFRASDESAPALAASAAREPLEPTLEFETVAIPMSGSAESLNVSVAAGIVLYARNAARGAAAVG
ncbi:MAG: NshR/TsnR family 23S rRNA methyltransferase [Bifidobacteriaceae bacterium]|jgi:TrmH family RNA methyltransferase|nr:NshR/TsnR family 23S rRNA methyltransferase [Bifidobacteriaceae bacterium]